MTRVWLAAGWTALAALACSGAEAAPQAGSPPREGWASVSEMLGARCGSLDCHGQSGRPLRLFHNDGLRLADDDAPGAGATTTDEHAANLRAVVGLEPELFARVVAEGGAAPERLTLVRKALGLESHKGGAPFALGTSGDVCLRSWLATKTDEAACATGAQVERP
ncbi:MAG: hypothetical protein BGO98_00940 [Myxococcales bacterium 68-20]|nr:hypothetical protein [Myxococcales bacterium]OJY17496.1 MAG: hypothetical protein BGO98_00940 [Myxococcales bacterium 68-20]